jgi:hypothetical protein
MVHNDAFLGSLGCFTPNLPAMNPIDLSLSATGKSAKVVAKRDPQKTATKELLQILSTEIARDGGASLVTSLKDYVRIPLKRLNSMLYDSFGKTKLLSFLENHCEIFHVNRNSNPHFVKLYSWEFVLQNELSRSTKGLHEASENRVFQKALYVLRKRQAKQNRRLQNNRNRANEKDVKSVNTYWLLKECSVDFHSYLRDSGIYHASIYPSTGEKDNVRVFGSREWQEVVLEEFETLLNKDSESRFELLHGKIWLSEYDETADNAPISDTMDDDYIDRLEETITKLVIEDGGHEIRLDLLLHRHKSLKHILCGRDLKLLLNQNPNRFDKIEIRYERDGIVFQKKNQTAKRMKVDGRVGMYSLASSKWGNAMANILVQCCRKVKWNLGESRGIVAVDLTASVGGFTLGLAKTRYFQRIIAVEIDKGRANLCEENMKEHGMDDIVTVQNADSMTILPTLSTHHCLILDPPWGGVRYKQQIDGLADLSMGSWTLLQIIVEIYAHCKPCLLGLRLPVVDIFKVDTFFELLRKEDGLKFEIVARRMLSVQRFVVLEFR